MMAAERAKYFRAVKRLFTRSLGSSLFKCVESEVAQLHFFLESYNSCFFWRRRRFFRWTKCTLSKKFRVGIRCHPEVRHRCWWWNHSIRVWGGNWKASSTFAGRDVVDESWSREEFLEFHEFWMSRVPEVIGSMVIGSVGDNPNIFQL